MHIRPDAVFAGVVDEGDLADVLAIRDAGLPPMPLGPLADEPGAAWILLPFLRVSPYGSRFSDGSYGVYYAAHSDATAIAETRFHYARFLAATSQPAALLGLYEIHADLDGRLADLRGLRRPELYEPEPARYGPAQRWAAEQRAAGAAGVVYDSVRDPGGSCVAVFRPAILRRARVHRALAYEWDGGGIVAVYTVSRLA